MARVLDVASYILTKRGPMTAMKLQKLCYYAQAWHLVWEERALFDEPIEAWANGPVVPALYRKHRGQFTLERGEMPGNPDALDDGERESVDIVLKHYGPKSAHWLSELSHREDPWRDTRARAGLTTGMRGAAEISIAEIFEYYDGLTRADEADDV